jgi:hypothetical protein
MTIITRTMTAQQIDNAYHSRRWDRIRRYQLQAEAYCRMCAGEGKVELGEHVDHIVPHKGDPNLFWDTNNLQTLCRATITETRLAPSGSDIGRIVGLMDGLWTRSTRAIKPTCGSPSRNRSRPQARRHRSKSGSRSADNGPTPSQPPASMR